MRISFLLIMALALPAFSQSDPDQGLSPARAIMLQDAEITRGTVSSVYYSMTASADGILDVTMTPIAGEIDLSITHYSGSPVIESRKEGLAPEEISTRVRKGDQFLIRVFSPFGRPATFRLSARVVTQMAQPVPENTGMTETASIMIPLGKFVPVEASGTRYFRVAVPAGYVLAASVYPVRGDVDMAVVGSGGRFTSSRRSELMSEHLYLPVATPDNVLVQIAPTAGSARYILLMRLLRPGLTSPENMEEPERMPRPQSSIDQLWNLGESAGSSSNILRLP